MNNYYYIVKRHDEMPLTGIRSFIGFVDDVSDDNDDGGNCSDGSATVIDLLVAIFIERDGFVLFAFVMSFLLGDGKASALLLMCNTPSGTDCTIGGAI